MAILGELANKNRDFLDMHLVVKNLCYLAINRFLFFLISVAN